jgi:hypothetical protein
LRHRTRFRCHQVPQRIRRIIPANAIFVSIHLQNILRPIRIMLQPRQRLQQPFKYYDDLIVTKSSGMSYNFAKYTDQHRAMFIPPGLAELGPDGRCHQTNDPLRGLQSPSQPGFKGPLYVLINGRCFSSGAEFLTEVHFHHRATFIGEESAGAYYGNNSGDVPRITLPNTRLGLFIPLVSYYMSVGSTHDHDPARGITPDYPVKYTIADLLAGTDKDLPLALELVRKSP